LRCLSALFNLSFQLSDFPDRLFDLTLLPLSSPPPHLLLYPAAALIPKHAVTSIEVAHVFDAATVAAHRADLETFFNLYVVHFEAHEREEVEAIRSRIAAQSDNHKVPQRSYTHIIIAQVASAKQQTREVVGGVILEYYPGSRTVLLSYIFVARAYRGRLGAGVSDAADGAADAALLAYGFDEEESGDAADASPLRLHVGEALLQREDCIPVALKRIASQHEAARSSGVCDVFFEANNPARVAAEADENGITPAHRLAFFRRVGAKRVPFQYVQPALNDVTSSLNELDLYVLPHLRQRPQKATISVTTIMQFVIDINYSLDRYHDKPAYPESMYKTDLNLALERDAVADARVLHKEGHLPAALERTRVGSRRSTAAVRQPGRFKGPKVEQTYLSLLETLVDALALDIDAANNDTPRGPEMVSTGAATLSLGDAGNVVDRLTLEASSLGARLRDGHPRGPSQVPPAAGLATPAEINLTEVPQAEVPFLFFPHASVSLVFVIDEERFKRCPGAGTAARASTRGPCPIFRSFELDLLSHLAQYNAPLETRFLEVIPVWVCFPERFNFVSEGRHELCVGMHRRLSFHDSEPGKVVAARVRLSTTGLRHSTHRVWHVTISPAEGAVFDEFDLVRLTKYYSGGQEHGSTAERLRQQTKIGFALRDPDVDFKPTNGRRFQAAPRGVPPRQSFRPLDIFLFDEAVGVAARYCDVAPADSPADPPQVVSLSHLEAGVLEIVVGRGHAYVQQRNGSYADDDVAEGFFEVVKGNEGVDDLVRGATRIYACVACGLALGIFDFRRMGLSEIMDTLRARDASLTDNSAIVINRGTMFALTVATGEVDSPLLSTADTIGMNPYLTVPMAVLVSNEVVGRETLDMAQKTYNALVVCESQSTLETLLDDMRRVGRRMRLSVLDNVFNYETERDLYDTVMAARGVSSLCAQIASVQEAFLTGVEQYQDRVANKHSHRLELLIAVVGVAQVSAVFFDFIPDDSIARITAGSVMAFCLVLFLFFELKGVHASRRARRHMRQTLMGDD
jgi:hypothetical protein